MTHYFGLSLGPITSTLARVRKTRELWGASFYFSLLMKRILKAVEDEGFEVLLPSTDFEEIPRNLGAGLFPDVMMLAATEADGETICKLSLTALDQLSKEIAGDMNEEEDAVVNYFRRYVQINVVSKSFDRVSDAIDGINELLHAAELRTQFQTEESEDFLFTYLKDKVYKSSSTLMKEAFPDIKGDENRILSIPEIACKGLEAHKANFRTEVLDRLFRENRKREDKGENEESLYAYLQKKYPDLAEHLRTYHRYIAVVFADGDNIGKTIGTITSQSEVDAFSRELLDFGIAAGNLIEQYGGKLVFAGGDDLLFFAPVKSASSTIFHLCNSLDNLFKETIRERDRQYPPSLSFGLSISYQKFPLYEALETGRKLLFQTAKKFPDENNRKKNALAFQLLKHSGQHFGQTLAMKSETYRSFQEIMKAELAIEGRFLSSVMFMIERQKAVFDAIGKIDQAAQRLERIQQVFANNFDETPHEGPAKDYLRSVEQLVNHAYSDYPWTEEKQGEDARKAVYSILRTIHFLKQAYDE